MKLHQRCYAFVAIDFPVDTQPAESFVGRKYHPYEFALKPWIQNFRYLEWP